MKKVVLIDDTLSLLEEIGDILQMEGFEVVTASNGTDGLLQVSKHKPDVVITDLLMPETNGFGVIEKIKSVPAVKHIPVVILSAQAEREYKKRAIELGAKAYLTKPCSADDLITTIHELTHE